MNTYRIHVAWSEPQSEIFDVEAENEEQAKCQVLKEQYQIGEDYEFESVEDLGPVHAPVEPEDPNQFKLFEKGTA